MPYFTGGAAGPNPSAISLDDLPSSSGAALSAGVENAWDSNPSVLAHDWWQLRSANDGTRLDNATAQAAINQAGVKLTVPDDGYTQAALDMLIQRKQNDARLQDTLARAPTGVVPQTTRFAAQLVTGLADPLNVAAGFIPVVGEARTASLLGAAGDSLLARTAARVGIGAAEGTAGVAALEPLAYTAHQQLQDDYGMVDSLRNVAFGAVLGGTLHALGGAVADSLRDGPHPAARFGGMSVDDVQSALNFQRERSTMAPEDQTRVLDTFTPEMRRAVEEPAPVDAIASQPQDSAAAVTASLSPEIRATAMRTAVADFVGGRTPDVNDVVGMDAAVQPIEARPVPLVKVRGMNMVDEAATLRQLPPTPDGYVRLFRGESPTTGFHDVFDAAALTHHASDLLGARYSPDIKVADYYRSSYGPDASLHYVDVPLALAERTKLNDSEYAIDLPSLNNARPPSTLANVVATAQRQARPESLAVGDFFASRAADELLAEQPRSARQADADTALSAAMDRVQSLRDNLVQGGMDPAVAQSMVDTLKPWDAGIADADKLGQAARAAALCGLRA